MLTTDADVARFTKADLDEATSLLTRLAACCTARLRGLGAAVPDAATWTIRQAIHHVSSVQVYAEMAGRLPTA